MNADHQPKAAFGRRGREVRAPAARADHKAKPARAMGRIVWLFGLASLLCAAAGAIFWTLLDIKKLDAETARAEQRVIAIVNQPITHLSRFRPDAVFSPGWFHPGAIKPDFNHVDVRTTQEFPYDGYVTSNLNSSEMFIGSELEFNPMTKYFYRDRSLPKKRLSDAEMVEINNLYRVIGRDARALSTRWLTLAGLIAAALCLGFVLLLPIRGMLARP